MALHSYGYLPARGGGPRLRLDEHADALLVLDLQRGLDVGLQDGVVDVRSRGPRRVLPAHRDEDLVALELDVPIYIAMAPYSYGPI